ncbi:MAG: hypothetical protein ACRDTM_01045 [Micromonosporaceae bacterium]
MTYQPAAPPPIDPAALRPKRTWYWIAALIVVLGVCGGFGIGLFGLSSIAGGLPTMKHEFDAGEATTVELTGDQQWAIYVDNPRASSEGQGSGPRPDVQCTGSSADGGTITLSEPGGSFHFTKDNKTWQLLYDVRVDKDGSYQIECSSQDAELTDPQLAVGPAVNVGGFVGKTFGTVGALLGLPCLALIVGGVIALVTGLRRSAHKKRLQAQGGYGTSGAPGAPPMGYPPA